MLHIKCWDMVVQVQWVKRSRANHVDSRLAVVDSFNHQSSMVEQRVQISYQNLLTLPINQ